MTAGLDSAGLDIVVSCGTGSGPTGLAAFDAALQAAGVDRFNLIRLSSLIPPGSRVRPVPGPASVAGQWGDRLYAVYADCRVTVPGAWARAGLGWVQDLDTGAGVLVEHAGGSESELEDRLAATLADVAVRRPGRFGPPELRVTGVCCEGPPVAAVVVASLRVEPW